MSDPTVPGGVANYFLVLEPYLTGVADYLTIGRRAGERAKTRLVARLLADNFRFASRLVRRRYDLVHLNPSFARGSLLRDGIFLLIAKAMRLPVLVFIRGWEVDCERFMKPRWNWLFRLVYSHANAFIVLAAEYGNKLRQYGYQGPIERETTVAPVEAFSAAPVCPIGDGKRFRILFLARIEKEKGIYEAMEAYRVLKQRHAAAELVVAGSGAESENARRYAQQRTIRDVRFIGHVTGPEKSRAFSESDVYLLPSYIEGMPNSVLEAMAHGLPVVTRAVGGIPDFFEHGRMGFMTDSLAPGVFAGFLEQVLSNREMAARMGTRNREYAACRFAANTVAKRLTGIYAKVIEGAGR